MVELPWSRSYKSTTSWMSTFTSSLCSWPSSCIAPLMIWKDTNGTVNNNSIFISQCSIFCLSVCLFACLIYNIGSRRSLRKLERLGSIGNLFIGLAQLRITEDLFLKSTNINNRRVSGIGIFFGLSLCQRFDFSRELTS